MPRQSDFHSITIYEECQLCDIHLAVRPLQANLKPNVTNYKDGSQGAT